MVDERRHAQRAESRVINLISVSGGKDSTATALKAVEDGSENLRFAFADTGHEHPQTYEYIAYLSDVLKARTGQVIQTVKADFSARIAAKREYILANWAKAGVPQAQIERALAILQPTGIPFLDLCLWKGRFPSPKARFCTTELKHGPLNELAMLLMAGATALVSWQGVRADESRDRADLPMREAEFGQWGDELKGLLIYRPILRWTADDVFTYLKAHGVRWNPLYEQGMGRVGCMPCIMARKSELREIARRFPEEIARVAEWERLVSEASKRGCSTFLDVRNIEKWDTSSQNIHWSTHGIHEQVRWAKTTRGGRHFDLIGHIEEQGAATCQSIYGLCE